MSGDGSKANQLQLMRRALLFTGAGLMVAAAGLPSFAAPKQTARTVTNGFVRSNVLLPLGGKKAVSNPVPCLLYTSPSPRDMRRSRMPSSA